jgi:hypothetical protein
MPTAQQLMKGEACPAILLHAKLVSTIFQKVNPARPKIYGILDERPCVPMRSTNLISFVDWKTMQSTQSGHPKTQAIKQRFVKSCACHSSIEQGIRCLDTTTHWQDTRVFMEGGQNEIRFLSQTLASRYALKM